MQVNVKMFDGNVTFEYAEELKRGLGKTAQITTTKTTNNLSIVVLCRQ
jgi:hypothetical protein